MTVCSIQGQSGGGALYTEPTQKVVIKWTGFHLKNRPIDKKHEKNGSRKHNYFSIQ